MISSIPTDTYYMQFLMVVLGVVVLAFGVALTVIANVIMNSGEAIVKAISDTLKKNFGNVKIVFDVSWVAFSILLSLIFFDMQIVGTREGTIIAAVCTGAVSKVFIKWLSPIDKILRGNK